MAIRCSGKKYNNRRQNTPALGASVGRLTLRTLCAGRFAPNFAHKVSTKVVADQRKIESR